MKTYFQRQDSSNCNTSSTRKPDGKAAFTSLTRVLIRFCHNNSSEIYSQTLHSTTTWGLRQVGVHSAIVVPSDFKRRSLIVKDEILHTTIAQFIWVSFWNFRKVFWIVPRVFDLYILNVYWKNGSVDICVHIRNFFIILINYLLCFTLCYRAKQDPIIFRYFCFDSLLKICWESTENIQTKVF